MAQSVKRPTSAQVMLSQFVSSGPVSGSVLTAQSLEPASDSGSPSLSAPSPLMLCLSLSFKHKFKKIFFKCFYLFLKERERQSMNRGGAEREGDPESKAGSRLQAVSTEPNAGLKLTNLRS